MKSADTPHPRDRERIEDARLFLDTALDMLIERELYIEGALTEKPVGVIPSPWFDGAKHLVAALRSTEERGRAGEVIE